MLGDRIRSQERVKVEMDDDFICIIISMDREIKSLDLEFPIPLRIEDVSVGGMKFWSRQELMIGLVMNFRMRVEGHIIDVKTKILRSREPEPGIYEVAAQFLNLSNHGQHLIKSFIKKKMVRNIWESRRKV